MTNQDTLAELAEQILGALEDERQRITNYLERLKTNVTEQLASTDETVSIQHVELGVEALAKQCLATASDAVNGTGFIANAEVFADAPALAWWYRPAGSARIEPLIVDAEFYDYTSAPWWTTSSHEHLNATGPYVDASGTNQYIVTFSMRVPHHQYSAGVVAADVLVAHFQHTLQKPLLALPPETALTDSEGAVLATNTGRLLGSRRPQTEPSHAYPYRPFNWTLHIGCNATGSADFR